MKNITVRMYKSDIKTWKIRFTDDGIGINGGKKGEIEDMPWSCIVNKWNTKKYIFLFLSKKVFIPIPKRSMTDEQIQFGLKEKAYDIILYVFFILLDIYDIKI